MTLNAVVLPGAVRADQPGDLALVDRERELVEREDAAEAPADVVDLEQRHRRLASHRSSRMS